MTGVQTCALPICFPVTISGIAKDYGKSILVWREIETEEGQRKTAKTMYTIKINGKIHTTQDRKSVV